jgi:hypothetical protein
MTVRLPAAAMTSGQDTGAAAPAVQPATLTTSGSLAQFTARNAAVVLDGKEKIRG